MGNHLYHCQIPASLFLYIGRPPQSKYGGFGYLEDDHASASVRRDCAVLYVRSCTWRVAGRAALTCVIGGVTYVATVNGTGVINGTAGNDIIRGSNDPDTINGLGGNDIICGRGGNDDITALGGARPRLLETLATMSSAVVAV